MEVWKIVIAILATVGLLYLAVRIVSLAYFNSKLEFIKRITSNDQSTDRPDGR